MTFGIIDQPSALAGEIAIDLAQRLPQSAPRRILFPAAFALEMTSRMRSRVICASLALPFQIRQCRRSISVTITALACSRSGMSIGMLQPHGDVEPVEVRRRRDAGIDQDRAQPGTAIGEGGDPGLLYLTNLGKAALDQHRNRGVGFGDRGKDLPGSTRCLDIAEPDFQMALVLLAAADEG